MAYCINCGELLEDNMNYCTQCGTKRTKCADIATDANVDTKNGDDKDCSAIEESAPNNLPIHTDKNEKTFLAAVGMLLLLVAGVVGGYFISKPTEEDTISQREAVAEDVTPIVIDNNFAEDTAVLPQQITSLKNIEETDAVQAFNKYWRDLNERNFADAYEHFSYNQQNRMGLFENYRTGYNNTIKSTPEITGTSVDNGAVYINYTLHAEDREGSHIRIQTFKGTATMVNINGKWKIEAMEAKRLESYVK